MIRILFSCLLLATVQICHSQELYVFSEPASNMPSNTITPKLSSTFGRAYNGENMVRLTPEVQLGFNKKIMAHLGGTFSNNTSSGNIQWESVYFYGKYRFLSIDDMHKHFRMAAFTRLSYSRNDYHFEEVNIQGERSGIQLGVIATQLLNKLALSGTVAHSQAMDPSRYDKETYNPERIYRSMDYSLSAGYLILPVEYKSFDQLNMNLYAELLGQSTLDRKSFYLDLAPAIQFIIRSNTKLNLGYRFQLDGNQFRGMQNSFLIAIEHTFYNALRKRN
jgi:hypothetical protein